MKIVKINQKLLFLILVILFLGVTFFARECYKQKSELTRLKIREEIVNKNNEIYKEFMSIPISIFEQRLKENDSMFVYIGNGECSDCSVFLPIVQRSVKKFKLEDKLFYVEGKYKRQNMEEWIEFKSQNKFNQTPAFIIYDKGRIVTKIEWTEKEGLSEQNFNQWISNNLDLIKAL